MMREILMREIFDVYEHMCGKGKAQPIPQSHFQFNTADDRAVTVKHVAL